MAARRKRTPAENAAIYARRQARSKAIYGAGYGAKKGARTRRRLNQVAPADVTAAPKPLAAQVGGRTITKTTGARSAAHALRALQDAAARRQRVEIQVTFLNAAGQPRTRRIDREPAGRPTKGARASRRGQSAGGGGSATSGSQAPLGPVQITAGGKSGASAKRLLDWILSTYGGDIWEAFYDWWDELYG